MQNLVERIVKLLERFLHWDMASLDHDTTIHLQSPKTPLPASVPTVEQAPAIKTQPVDKIRLCALAQQEFEGWTPGSNSFIRNNPGNLRSIAGPFLVFPTYALGLQALEDYIHRVATGKHRAYPKGGKTTLMEYTHIYTSDPPPSPENYAKFIAIRVGLTVSSPMSDLL